MVLSIVLPTYNEADNISGLLTQIHALPQVDEIIVVDDDSPDKTWEVVQALQFPKVRVIRRMDDRGLVSALNRGIHEATGDLVTWMDADGAMSPAEIPKLLSARQQADIAIGSRYVPGGHDFRPSLLRRLSSLVINRLARIVLRTKVHDFTTGFVLARRDWLLKHPLEGAYGDYCIRFLIQAERAGLSIAEIPYDNQERRQGKSKTQDTMLSFCRLGLGYLKTIWQLR